MRTEGDRVGLGRALEVAGGAVAAGAQPFAAVLMDAQGRELVAEHNRTSTGDATRHAELAVVRWAVTHLPPGQRAGTVLYCSGEPCPMCAGAHGWAGLGRIVYAVAATRILGWMAELGVPAPPVHPVAVRDVLPGTTVDGPLAPTDERVHALYGLFRAGTQHERSAP